MPSLRQSVNRLRDRWMLATSSPISVRDLNHRFAPVPSGSLRALLGKLNLLADQAVPTGGSHHPYHRRSRRGPFHVISGFRDGHYVDLRHVHLAGGAQHSVAEAVRRFDARAAEFVRSSTGMVPHLHLFPPHDAAGAVVDDPNALLEERRYNDGVITAFIPRAKCLAALAYPDFFPYMRAADGLCAMVSAAVLAARPGWCGTFGPKFRVGDILPETTALLAGYVDEGNYDLSQMHLLPMAYRYYDELSSEAREHLITELLAHGRVNRINESEVITSGKAPNDWSRAGFVYIPPVLPFGLFSGHQRIGETENHILQIHTVRYLSNQLMYQRTRDPVYDNRRNGSDDAPACTPLMLTLLRNFLRCDFSEYNAKSYQHETRNALLNLCSYAYDHDVRLAARMVLDYVSAHVAVSSCDLRRLVPFRRINEGKNSKQIVESRFMDVSLLDWPTGCDPNTEHFAVQAGNLRAYETVTPLTQAPLTIANQGAWRGLPWSILGEGGDGMMEALSDYRLPPSIHDLFVNDSHRRFFQRLHRTQQADVESGQNCDNMEIYACSPSYLITAGGSPAGWAIDPGAQQTFEPAAVRKQLGVAVTTSFMPTAPGAGPGTQNYARDLIQFSSFAQEGAVENYGVAPDFACGHVVHMPPWVETRVPHRLFSFVDKGSTADRPGFFLAFCRDGAFTVMEAYDTWLHPGLSFDAFRIGVYERNKNLRLNNHEVAEYVMTNGNRVRFSIWFDPHDGDGDDDSFGASVHSIEYGPDDANDSIGDASKATGFLNGTILNSRAEAVIEITNPGLQSTITLDMNDPFRPRRVSETGEVEDASPNHEVWVDFGWRGPNIGDFFQPFSTLAGAWAAVADGGVIKVVPGWTSERPVFGSGKRVSITAPIGGVAFGVR